MIYITLDTCVWLELLKIDFNNEDNLFEEICFWIENNHIGHIVPTNIIDEWNRHKIGNQNKIYSYFKKKENDDISFFKNNSELSSTYKPEEIEKKVQKRIERIDLIFSNYSEKAPYNDAILKEAGIRNLNTLAPNHNKDSFRDTVNILSLIYYLKKKGYSETIFTTINYKDFSAGKNKKDYLHDKLIPEFAAANLTYIFFGENESFGMQLLSRLRNDHSIPSFQEYLKKKKDEEETQALAAKKPVPVTSITNPDSDYLENIKYIDIILAKRTPTVFEQEIIKSLIERHTSYKQYFFKNIGNNGLV